MLIYGAGGHGKVIKEAIESMGEKVLAFFDDNSGVKSQYDIEVLPYDPNKHSDIKIIIAIGDNGIRRRITSQIKHDPGIAIDANARYASSLVAGKGSVILKGAIVQADAVLGKSVIVNTGAIVEHDCIVGDFVHLAPGSIICGGVTIGENSMIGAGAVVLPGMSIGKNCIVGAGSVVNFDLKDNMKVVGNPCRKIN